MKSTVHRYDNIIIGSTLEALIYSYITNYPVFFAGSRCPKEFEYLEPAMVFQFLKSETKNLNTSEGLIEVGGSKQQLWENLIFCLSLAGLIPIADVVNSIRIESDGTVRLAHNNRTIVVEAKNIHLFDSLGVSGVGEQKPIGQYKVYDWLSYNSIYPHQYDMIKTEYNVCSELWFLESVFPKRLHDGCIVSKFESEAEMHKDLTEYNLKFILKDTFKKYGLKGKANGVYHMDKSIQRYKQVQYTQIHREIEPPIYFIEGIDNVQCLGYTIGQLKDLLQPNPKIDKLWNVLKIT